MVNTHQDFQFPVLYSFGKIAKMCTNYTIISLLRLTRKWSIQLKICTSCHTGSESVVSSLKVIAIFGLSVCPKYRLITLQRENFGALKFIKQQIQYTSLKQDNNTPLLYLVAKFIIFKKHTNEKPMLCLNDTDITGIMCQNVRNLKV